jgi:inner membrane protein
MPSPVGHALAGLSVVYAADIIGQRRSSTRLVVAAAALAALPDADLLLPGAHRTLTHSVTAACVTFIVAAAVTGQVTRLRAPRFSALARWRTATICGLAYASHLLLDWLGADNTPPRGIQLFWPWSHRWFISDLDIFPQTARRHFLTAPTVYQNLLAVGQELLILVPVVLVLWLVRVKTATRFAPEVTGGHHPPE